MHYTNSVAVSAVLQRRGWGPRVRMSRRQTGRIMPGLAHPLHKPSPRLPTVLTLTAQCLRLEASHRFLAHHCPLPPVASV